MSQANLKAVVTAEDKASSPISKLTESINKLSTATTKLNSDSSKAGNAIKSNTGSVVAGIAVYSALTRTLQRVGEFFGSSIKAANEYQSAMIGLSTVSRSFGVSANSATSAVKELSADGLIPVADSANALKNLLASGFSLPQAIQLLKGLKDQAAFNRQSFYSLGGAVRATTEGIKNGNSVLADATGTTKNLSVMAKEAGVGIDEMGSIATNSSYRMAVLNGFLSDTARSAGDAGRYTETFAGAQSRAAYASTELKRSIGTLVQTAGKPLLQTFTKFITANKESVASFAIAGAGAIAFATTILGLVKVGTYVVNAIRIMTLTSGALGVALFALSLLIGAVLYKAMGKVQNQLMGQNSALSENESAATDAATATEGLGGAQEDLGKKIEKVNQQIARENRNYQESLAEMVRDHKAKVKDIEGQISDESASFAESQAEAADSHEERVAKIQDQINKELAMGYDRNQQVIDGYYREIQQENEAYEKKVAKDKANHEKKMADMQTELDAETAMLQKHADDVTAVKDIQLLDDFEKLKRSHAEQMVEYEVQKNDIIANARATAGGIAGAYNAIDGGAIGSGLGAEIGQGMKQAVFDSVKEITISFMKFMYRIADTIKQVMGKGAWKLLGKSEFWENPGASISSAWKQAGANADADFATSSERAIGGPVTSGRPFLVGERGPELFVPPASGKIVPNDRLGGGGGGQINVTINAQAFAGSQVEARKFAQMIMEAYQDAKLVRGIA